MTRSLSSQISAIRHCIAVADDGHTAPEVIANAEAGLKSLEWMERNTEIIREVRRLFIENKAVIELLRAFPEARVQINGS